VGEICLPGGSCSAGFECRSEAGREQGGCFVRSPGADCAGKRCSGDTPVCRFAEESRSATCVASDDGASNGEPEVGVFRFGCTSAADCGGYACGKLAESPFQSFHCGGWSLAGDRFWPILCADVRDCPNHWGNAATGCTPAPEGELPSFAKQCVYPE